MDGRTWGRFGGSAVGPGEALRSLESGPSEVRSVLVIEDDESLRVALTLRLEAEGYRVHAAADGIDGLRSLCLRDPALVVLDLGLPRMHGFKLLEHLRRNVRYSGPILVITGSDDRRVVERAPDLGVKRVLHKPVGLRTVSDAVRDLLAS